MSLPVRVHGWTTRPDFQIVRKIFLAMPSKRALLTKVRRKKRLLDVMMWNFTKHWNYSAAVCCWGVFFLFFGISFAAEAQSEVWTFRANFMNDAWNTPILPYLATIPIGQSVSPENIRAQVKQSDLVALRAQVDGDRFTKRQVFQKLESVTDVDKARKLLLPDNSDLEVAMFQTAAGYFDKLGLLGIMQIVTTWQCRADEQCPQKVMQHLDSLLAVGGKFVKSEVFKDVDGKPWIFTTVTYEVPVGQELRVVPLRSRKLEIQPLP